MQIKKQKVARDALPYQNLSGSIWLAASPHVKCGIPFWLVRGKVRFIKQVKFLLRL